MWFSAVSIRRYLSVLFCCCFFFFNRKTAYEMRMSDWSSDVCSSDLAALRRPGTSSALVARLRRASQGRTVPAYGKRRRLIRWALFRADRARGRCRRGVFPMATLIRIALLAALIVAAPANADPVQRWRPFIAEASARFGIPAAWIERVMRAESGGRTRLHGEPITSWAGAMGLMQLMPGRSEEHTSALQSQM